LTTHADNIIVQGDSNTFSNGADLAFGPNGKLHVLDISGATPQVLEYNADGTGQTVFTNFNSPGFTPADFEPANLAFGPNGNLYVDGLYLDSLNPNQGEVLQISPDGSTSTTLVSNLTAPGFLAFTPTAVPEPSSLCLLVIGAAASLRRRGRVSFPAI
jgi:hypothetical protein